MVSLETAGSTTVPRIHVGFQKEPVFVRLKLPQLGRPLGGLPVLDL